MNPILIKTVDFYTQYLGGMIDKREEVAGVDFKAITLSLIRSVLISIAEAAYALGMENKE